jgi:hypothetical protein
VRPAQHHAHTRANPSDNHAPPANRRWPGCSAAHYGGDWHRLYRCRAALPAELPREADRLHALTLRASGGAVRLNSASIRVGGAHSCDAGGASAAAAAAAGGGGGGGAGGGGAPGSPSKANVYGFAAAPYCNVAGMLLEEAMRSAFAVGLALAGGGAARRPGAAAAEAARFQEDAAWWLAHRPEVRGPPGARGCVRLGYWHSFRPSGPQQPAESRLHAAQADR